MRITVHRSKDGTAFNTAAECKAHDDYASIEILAGLSLGDLHAGLKRENIEIASSLELAGKLVANKRRESGAFKRAPKNSLNKHKEQKS